MLKCKKCSCKDQETQRYNYIGGKVPPDINSVEMGETWYDTYTTQLVYTVVDYMGVKVWAQGKEAKA